MGTALYPTSLVGDYLKSVQDFNTGVGTERQPHPTAQGLFGEDLRDTRSHRCDDIDIPGVPTLF